MVDESVFTLADAWNVLRAHAADVISIYPGKNGGIAAAIEIAHVAQAAGVPCHVGSNLELGIGSAAMLHLACAVPNIDSETYPADILGPHYHETDLLTEPLALNPDGGTRAGRSRLGVELDEEAVAPLPGSTTDRRSGGWISSNRRKLNRQGRQGRQEERKRDESLEPRNQLQPPLESLLLGVLGVLAVQRILPPFSNEKIT